MWSKLSIVAFKGLQLRPVEMSVTEGLIVTGPHYVFSFCK